MSNASRHIVSLSVAMSLLATATFPQSARANQEVDEDWKQILRDNGHQDLLDDLAAAEQLSAEATKGLTGSHSGDGGLTFSTRPLQVLDGFSREVIGYWTNLGIGSALSGPATKENAGDFYNQVLLNFTLYLKSDKNKLARELCVTTAHDVSNLSVDAIQPADVNHQGYYGRLKVFYRIQFGRPQESGYNCSGQVQLRETEMVYTLDSKWYVPAWGIYLRAM